MGKLRILVTVLTLIFGAETVAVAADLGSDLVGRWQQRHEIFQFFAGGTATTTQTKNGQVQKWSWQALDATHILLNNVKSPSPDPEVIEVHIQGDVLILKQSGKIIGRYTRVP